LEVRVLSRRIDSSTIKNYCFRTFLFRRKKTTLVLQPKEQSF
jgi:hypothetical protein